MCFNRRLIILKKCCAVASVLFFCFTFAGVVLSDDAAGESTKENIEEIDASWEGMWSGTKLNSYDEEEDISLTFVKESEWKIDAEIFEEEKGEWQWEFDGSQLSGLCIVKLESPSSEKKNDWLIRKLFLRIHENHLNGWCGERIKSFSDSVTPQEIADTNIEQQDILMDRMP